MHAPSRAPTAAGAPEQSLEDDAPPAGVVLPVAHGRQAGAAVVELPPGEKNPFRQALQFAPPVPGEQTETARRGSKRAGLVWVLGCEAAGPWQGNNHMRKQHQQLQAQRRGAPRCIT